MFASFVFMIISDESWFKKEVEWIFIVWMILHFSFIVGVGIVECLRDFADMANHKFNDPDAVEEDEGDEVELAPEEPGSANPINSN
jgi:hypothetical protein